MKRYTDQQIIENILKKDAETMQFLHNEYLPIVKYLVYHCSYRSEKVNVQLYETDAEDILYDALYILIKKIYDNNFVLTSKLSTYVYAVCKNLVKMKLKKKYYEVKYQDAAVNHTEFADDFDEYYDDHLKNNVFEHYYQMLSGMCKEILKYYWTDYSVAEIAEKTGNTKNYIMKRKYECQNRLIELIKLNPDHI